MSDLQYTLGLDPSGFGAGVRAGIGMAGDLSNAVRGLADLWQGVLDAFEDTASFESTTTAIQTMTRNMAVTRQIMKELAEEAASTPFEMPELASAGRQLLGAGTAVSNLKDELRVLGDISAGANTDIGGIVTVFNQVRGKAVLLTDDFQQLAERGVSGLREELAKVKGIEVEAVAKALSDSKIGADDLMQAFRNMTSEGGQYFEAMVNQSKTFNGVLSGMQDDVAAFMREFEAPTLDLMKPVMQEIGREVKGMTGEARVFVATLKQAAANDELGQFIGLSVSIALKSAWLEFAETVGSTIPSIQEIVMDGIDSAISDAWNRNLGNFIGIKFDAAPRMGGGFDALGRELEVLKKQYADITAGPREQDGTAKELDRMSAKLAAEEAARKKTADDLAKKAREEAAARTAGIEAFNKEAEKYDEKNRKVFTLPKPIDLAASPRASALPTASQINTQVAQPIVNSGKQAGAQIASAAQSAGQQIAAAIRGPAGAGTGERTPGKINARIAPGGADAARLRAEQRGNATEAKAEGRRSQMGSLAGLYGRPGNVFGNLDYQKDIARAQASTTPTNVPQQGGGAGGGGVDKLVPLTQQLLQELQRIRTE